jgi:hypothetical protein
LFSTLFGSGRNYFGYYYYNDVTEQVYAKGRLKKANSDYLMADLMPAKINNALVDGSVTVLINTG